MDAKAMDIQEDEFEARVLVRSREVPVVVDFWAPWCGPCNVLGPVLEKVVGELDGAVDLVKVNTDAAPQLAAAFGIQSLPTVALFVDGRPADAFMGAQPESFVRDFLAKHVHTTGDALVEHAEALFRDGDLAGAATTLDGVLAGAEEDAPARLLRARVAMAQGEEDAVRSHVAALPAETPEARAGALLLEGLAFRAGCGEGEAPWRRRMEDDASDFEAVYGLGCCQASQGRYDEALETFFDLVRRDRTWNDGAARKAMVTIFGILGHDDERTREYRRRLTIVL